ncbi:MAG: leucine-rich repeat domain-containing protein [Lachnospiraceae bacterium]|nr:leucine-rich repeat domain-containing protein [Lachnospiraceae bacterium]MBP5604408.1 leucine-rich repeat domain-containing protein [Ruminiclostridium sp.]
MKKGTKIGWLLVALSIVLSVWVIIAQSSKAVEENGFVVDDSGTITAYTGGLSNISGMPDSANSIAASAFATNPDITSVNIGSNITSLAPGCFAGCNSLSSVSGGSYSSIPSQCFYNCGSLTSYTIPGSVSSIGSQAFQGAGISGITIPANVTSIASDAFDETYNLTNIAVDSGNSVYSSHNSCLYNKSGSNLIRVPFGASSASIYSGCATIGSGAFSGC